MAAAAGTITAPSIPQVQGSPSVSSTVAGAAPTTSPVAPSSSIIPPSTQSNFASSIPTTLQSNNATQAGNAAAQQIQAPPVIPQQAVGQGTNFSVNPQPPATVLSPPNVNGINNVGNELPYMTAQTNQANAQQFQNLQQGEQAIATGYGQAQQQLSTLGTSEQQQLGLQEQQQLAANSQAQASGGTLGSSGDIAGQTSAQRTYESNLASLTSQVAQAQGQVLTAGNTALAQYLTAPQYSNDNSTLLQAMEAVSGYQSAESANDAASATENAATLTGLASTVTSGLTAIKLGFPSGQATGFVGGPSTQLPAPANEIDTSGASGEGTQQL
jgi:hypothetical protein